MTVVANNKSAADANVAEVAKYLREGTALPVGRIFTSRTVTVAANSALLNTKRGGGIAGQVATSIQNLGTGPVIMVDGACGFHSRGAVELVGNGTAAAIQIAGKNDPPTGRHKLDTIVATNCSDGILCTGNDHADNSTVEELETFATRNPLTLDNPQAVNWHIGTLRVNYLGGPNRQNVVNAKQACLVTIDRLTSLHADLTILRVDGFSPNSCGLSIRYLEFDNYAPQYPSKLTLFKYDGPTHPENPHWDMRYIRWRVRVLDGFICPNIDPATGTCMLDTSKWFDIPAEVLLKRTPAGEYCGLDLTDIRWDIRNAPAPTP